MPQLAEKRMIAHAETNPTAQIRYHTVADGHADEPALAILSGILNGRTGRLYKSLVLDQKVATSASASQQGYRFEGLFALNGVAREGRSPEEVEMAIHAEIEKLKTEPVSDRELQKVKNNELVSQFRRLQSNFPLMFELLLRDVSRSWETINTDPPRLNAVTAEDVVRVAKKYFTPENRTVAIYHRKEGTGGASVRRDTPASGGLQE
jgi:predicted Zn-dependent peptidase